MGNRERERPGSPVIRTLRAEEIECRVSIIKENGLGLLLFKDARVDQKILDETFTPFGWKRSHQEINGNLYCTVEIWDKEKKEWVGKQDVGTESYSEKEKGQASDSFKRACFNWGVGRELYTAPFIWVPVGQAEIQKKGRAGDEKYYTNDRFRVKSISYDEERSIASLVVTNTRGEIVYTWEKEGAQTQLQTTGRKVGIAGKQPGLQTKGRKKSAAEKTGQAHEGLAEERKVRDEVDFKQKMETLDQELQRTGVALEKVLERYHIRGVTEMTTAMYQDAISGLKKSKDKKAA